jgi:integrase
LSLARVLAAHEALDERLFAHREAKGLTPVGDVYRAHIAPVIGDKHPRDWTVEDCEAVRDSLDAKITAGSWKREERVYRFGWKRAWNVWALFTSACKASCRSKNKALRVRRDNPCAGVETPDRGVSKQKQWLYPDEFIKLVSDESLPLRWVRLYRLLTYTYLRPNELAALLWKDVDLETGIIHVSKAWNFTKDEAKPFPQSAAGVRFVPIEIERRPLLTSLKEGAEETDHVVPNMPPPEDWAAALRAHLARAGIARAALFDDSETVKQITLHDLRASGITWRTLRSDDARLIQRAAGHEHYSTTEGYVREAEIFKGRVGAPFQSLPASLIRSGVNRNTQSITGSPAVSPLSP